MERHDEVAQEMEKRGMNHDSPLQYRDSLGFHSDLIGVPFQKVNRASLFSRCSDCRSRSKSVSNQGVKEVKVSKNP